MRISRAAGAGHRRGEYVDDRAGPALLLVRHSPLCQSPALCENRSTGDTTGRMIAAAREGKRVAELPKGLSTLKAQLAPYPSESMMLELRCRGWVPQKVSPESQDIRVLGVGVYSILMRAEGAKSKVFNANRGE